MLIKSLKIRLNSLAEILCLPKIQNFGKIKERWEKRRCQRLCSTLFKNTADIERYMREQTYRNRSIYY